MTRTFHLGEPTKHERVCFTRVLQVMRATICRRTTCLCNWTMSNIPATSTAPAMLVHTLSGPVSLHEGLTERHLGDLGFAWSHASLLRLLLATHCSALWQGSIHASACVQGGCVTQWPSA